MSWSLIVSALLSVLANSKVPAWVLGLLKSWLGGIKHTEVSIPAGDAPDGLKTWLKAFLLQQVASIKMPFVRLVLTRLIENLNGAILDQVWDRLFPVGGVMKAAAPIDLGVDFEALATDELAE